MVIKRTDSIHGGMDMNDYQKGYKAALEDVLDHLSLIGGPDMELLIKQIRYKMAKGIDYDYPIFPEDIT